MNDFSRQYHLRHLVRIYIRWKIFRPYDVLDTTTQRWQPEQWRQVTIHLFISRHETVEKKHVNPNQPLLI